MGKKNVTLKFFESNRPSDGAHYELPPPNAPENRMPIGRLSFSQGEEACNWSHIEKTIRDSALPETTIFLDSSFFDRREIPLSLWEALLTRKICFTPLVWKELKDWRENPYANKEIAGNLVRLVNSGDPRVEFIEPKTWPDSRREGGRRYIELLMCRKLTGWAAIHEFEKRNGRKPNDDELRQFLQKSVQDRGLTLAGKGIADYEKHNFPADEELVVGAIINAIFSKRETMILTRDVDLLEQFYKAIYLAAR